MAIVVYALCAMTSIVCASVLLRSYRRGRNRLLLWSSLCFICLALNNILLFLDLVVIESIDFSIPRILTALAALSIMLFGLIWETV